MSLLFKLNALHKIQSDMSLFLETEYFEARHAQYVRTHVTKCCALLKRHMVKLTYAMLPDESL